jgi:hypothetical protein
MKNVPVPLLALIGACLLMGCSVHRPTAADYASCEVSVNYPDGGPVHCAKVTFTPPNGQNARDLMVAPNGKGIVSGLVPGISYSVRVSSYCAAPIPTRQITVNAGSLGALKIIATLPAQASLAPPRASLDRGQVVALVGNITCQPLAGVKVLLEGPEVPPETVSLTNDSGIVCFDSLVPGKNYQLYTMVWPVGYLPVRRKGLVVRANESLLVPLTLSKSLDPK